jgi:hypothetical protein
MGSSSGGGSCSVIWKVAFNYGEIRTTIVDPSLSGLPSRTAVFLGTPERQLLAESCRSMNSILNDLNDCYR